MKEFNINDIDLDDLLWWDKRDLINLWIFVREETKRLSEIKQIVNVILMDEYGIEWKENYDWYDVFIKESTSYTALKGFDYSSLMKTDPKLFKPAWASFYKKYPQFINRKISTTVEISKPKTAK